ncbi:chloride channel protein [Streptomyces flavotricini]|uniref:Chloride channel protein n=1 Tax=Streptomyces flavotricini TaxID=66888 RepID=A0ABS8EFL8_9ACTN|nr:chloride channel protein [Streptomyces flavotricini]MCC0099950.1 chloride channel protein [Streptomyces flavotricini]
MTQPTQPSPNRGPGPGPQPPSRPAEAQKLGELIRTPGYRKTLVFCGLIGIPVSLAAFWFLAGLQTLEGLVWVDLPHALGHDTPPWWWPLPLLLLSGVCVGQIVTRLPGAGGHVPASGLHAGGPGAAALPGVVLAAVFSLPLGATLGPEAPLIALGGGLAIGLRHLTGTPETPMSTALLGAAGSAAAIATIFGNPLIGAVLLMEVVGVGGPQLFAVMLPALLASGIGSLVFTGFGHWTGLKTGDLSLKEPSGVQFPRLDAGDVLWSILLAAALAVGVHLVQYGGRLTAVRVARRPLTVTALCALAAGACAAAYSLGTGRSPVDVASSGQNTLAQLAGDPHAWGVGALIAVLLCKGAAFSLCLGSLRGGPIFPSLFLGAAAGVLCSPLAGFGVGAGLAAGMAAATVSALRLPVSSVVLVVLVLGSTEMIPVAILATVVALVTIELLPPGPAIPPVGRMHRPAVPAP